MRSPRSGQTAQEYKGSLKVRVAKGSAGRTNQARKRKLDEIRDNPQYQDGIQEDIQIRIAKLNENLSVRQESINLLKGRLTNQITSFKDTTTKVLDKDIH